MSVRSRLVLLSIVIVSAYVLSIPGAVAVPYAGATADNCNPYVGSVFRGGLCYDCGQDDGVCPSKEGAQCSVCDADCGSCTAPVLRVSRVPDTDACAEPAIETIRLTTSGPAECRIGSARVPFLDRARMAQTGGVEHVHVLAYGDLSGVVAECAADSELSERVGSDGVRSDPLPLTAHEVCPVPLDQPTIAVLAPQSGATVSSGEVVLRAHVTASTATSCVFYVDGVERDTVRTNGDAVMSTQILEAGAHSWQLRCGAKENDVWSAVASFFVTAESAISVAVLSPIDRVELAATGGFPVTWIVDARSPAQCSVLVDGAPVAAAAVTPGKEHTEHITAALGSRDIRVQCRPAQGSGVPSEAKQLVVVRAENEQPVVVLRATEVPLPGQRGLLSYTVSDNSVLRCSLLVDGAVMHTVSVHEGTHTFAYAATRETQLQVSCTDTAGVAGFASVRVVPAAIESVSVSPAPLPQTLPVGNHSLSFIPRSVSGAPLSCVFSAHGVSGSAFAVASGEYASVPLPIVAGRNAWRVQCTARGASGEASGLVIGVGACAPSGQAPFSQAYDACCGGLTAQSGVCCATNEWWNPVVGRCQAVSVQCNPDPVAANAFTDGFMLQASRDDAVTFKAKYPYPGLLRVSRDDGVTWERTEAVPAGEAAASIAGDAAVLLRAESFCYSLSQKRVVGGVRFASPQSPLVNSETGPACMNGIDDDGDSLVDDADVVPTGASCAACDQALCVAAGNLPLPPRYGGLPGDFVVPVAYGSCWCASGCRTGALWNGTACVPAAVPCGAVRVEASGRSAQSQDGLVTALAYRVTPPLPVTISYQSVSGTQTVSVSDAARTGYGRVFAPGGVVASVRPVCAGAAPVATVAFK